jgi:hypothetical protein
VDGQRYSLGDVEVPFTMQVSLESSFIKAILILFQLSFLLQTLFSISVLLDRKPELIISVSLNFASYQTKLSHPNSTQPNVT